MIAFRWQRLPSINQGIHSLFNAQDDRQLHKNQGDRTPVDLSGVCVLKMRGSLALA
jgi:hypothetical protein